MIQYVKFRKGRLDQSIASEAKWSVRHSAYTTVVISRRIHNVVAVDDYRQKFTGQLSRGVAHSSQSTLEALKSLNRESMKLQWAVQTWRQEVKATKWQTQWHAKVGLHIARTRM
jgi:hypothetical protein